MRRAIFDDHQINLATESVTAFYAQTADGSPTDNTTFAIRSTTGGLRTIHTTRGSPTKLVAQNTHDSRPVAENETAPQQERDSGSSAQSRRTVFTAIQRHEEKIPRPAGTPSAPPKSSIKGAGPHNVTIGAPRFTVWLGSLGMRRSYWRGLLPACVPVCVKQPQRQTSLMRNAAKP